MRFSSIRGDREGSYNTEAWRPKTEGWMSKPKHPKHHFPLMLKAMYANLYKLKYFLHEILQFVDEFVQLVVKSVRFVHESDKFVHKSVELVHESVKLVHESIQLVHNLGKLVFEFAYLHHTFIRTLIYKKKSAFGIEKIYANTDCLKSDVFYSLNYSPIKIESL